MTSLREAATQALEALEDFGMRYYENTGEVLHRDVYESLKSALVEDAMQKFTDVNQELEAALAEPVQEPVAWRFQSAVGGWAYGSQPPVGSKYPAFPLYAAPPQRKPLSEEEIDSIWDSEKAFADIYAIVRAVERAHGIV